MKTINNFKKLSELEKKKNYGGTLWTASIAFSLIGSTISGFVQLILGIINTFNGNENSSSNSSSSIKTSNYSNNNIYTRLSKYPSSSTINYQL